MSDRRFDDIAIEHTIMRGQDGKYHTAVCKTCSKQHKVTSDEFRRTDLFTIVTKDDGYDTKRVNELERKENADEIMKYVAKMRAWNCCHGNEEPLNGFPKKPDANNIAFEQ